MKGLINFERTPYSIERFFGVDMAKRPPTDLLKSINAFQHRGDAISDQRLCAGCAAPHDLPAKPAARIRGQCRALLRAARRLHRRRAPRRGVIEQYDGSPSEQQAVAIMLGAIVVSATPSWLRTSSACIRPTTRRPTSRATRPASTGGSSGAAAELATIAVGDRITPVAAEGTTAHAYAGRRLAPLVLGTLDHIEHARDHGAIEPALADLLDRQIILDEASSIGSSTW